MVQIMINNRKKYLGLFSSKKEAVHILKMYKSLLPNL